MPQNGAAIALPFAPHPPARLAAEALTDKPADPIEHRIAEATADAVGAVARGVLDYARIGVLDPPTRATAGNFFVKLFELQEATMGELDFSAVARRQGKKLIRQRHAASAQGTTLDQVIDDLLTAVLDVLAKVTADERARAN